MFYGGNSLQVNCLGGGLNRLRSRIYVSTLLINKFWRAASPGLQSASCHGALEWPILCTSISYLPLSVLVLALKKFPPPIRITLTIDDNCQNCTRALSENWSANTNASGNSLGMPSVNGSVHWPQVVVTSEGELSPDDFVYDRKRQPRAKSRFWGIPTPKLDPRLRKLPVVFRNTYVVIHKDSLSHAGDKDFFFWAGGKPAISNKKKISVFSDMYIRICTYQLHM